MNEVVVDASVAVKWFVPEVRSLEAVRLLDTASAIAAPDFIAIEIANTLWKKVRRRELESGDAAAVLAGLAAVPITMVPASDVLPAALELAMELGCTVYDSLYLAVAIALDRVVVTADQKFAAAIADTPFAARIRLLQPLKTATPTPSTP